ncbi:MAG: 3-phenylpropionate/cinnamic acid dioxygenase small subunit, partial [Alphaproteobacteria bacterium]
MTSNLSPAQSRELRLEIEEFNTEYARTLDAGDVEGWADYFVEDGFYRV